MYQYINMRYEPTHAKRSEHMTESMNDFGRKGWRVINMMPNMVDGSVTITYEAPLREPSSQQKPPRIQP